ncbi:MAG: hypothetical protein IT204_23495 [Fimbriimonadaceae bacterium]|nr:hypothetical protein [Fimbriimonadaceae bacterium]
MRWSVLLAVVVGRLGAAVPYERIAATQETLVSAFEGGGEVGWFTYDHTDWLDHLALGKLRVAVIGADGQPQWLAAAPDRAVRNSPDGAGVEVSGTVGGVAVRLIALPTTVGRDTQRWEGAAVFEVTCRPAARLLLRYGAPGRTRIHAWRTEKVIRTDYIHQPDLLPAEAATTKVNVAGRQAQFVIPVLPAVAATGPAAWTAAGPWVEARTAAVTSTYVVAAFASNPARAAELAAADGSLQARACRQRFAALPQASHIETPDAVLDEAYRAALINLEYTWLRPFGWIESLRHWGTFWTMQHTLAADWLGQQDRSRECLETHAARLQPSGQVPDLDPSGRARVDFGGWNQFFVWSVDHHWRQTADRGFLQTLDEPLRRVVAQTFAAHDPDGNGLLGFGQQIGNQEDYISTPHDGTSPSVAGLEMLRVRAEFARALGRPAEAAQLLAQRQTNLATLRRELFDRDLGRFIFYRDQLGVPHLDGQYHSAIWPVICGVLDGREAYQSMLHVADTLTGPEGQIFCSNNFPRHVRATVGSQDGAQQQPWATLGWAAVGDGQRAVRPLQWIARWVTNEANRGSWPEVAENLPAYFSPPAGVFVSGTIEGLFGLRLDRPAGVLTLAPCLPPAWPGARLVTPEVTLRVTQQPTGRTLQCRCRQAQRLALRMFIPPARSASLRVDGRPVSCRLSGAVNASRVLWDSPGPLRAAKLELTWQPLTVPAAAPVVTATPAPDPLAPYGAAGRRAAGRRWAFRPCDPHLTNSPWQPVELRSRSAATAAAPLTATPAGWRLGERQLTDADLAHLGPGAYRWPDGATTDLAPLFTAESDLRALALARCQPVELPADRLQAAADWKGWRWWSCLGHPPWWGLQPPLAGLDSTPLEPPTVPGLRFAGPGERLAVVSRHLDQHTLRVPLSGRAWQVYLLLLPLLDNINVYAPVARVTVRCGDGTFHSRLLHFPGDLDWWGPRAVIGDFATADTDWCRSPRYAAPQAVLNVIAVDLQGWRPVESMTVESIGAHPCLGVVAVTSFGAPPAAAALPAGAARFAQHLPQPVAVFDRADLAGWSCQGTAWGVGEALSDRWQRRGAGRWFADSLAHGETATGTIRSAPFQIRGRRLEFLADGHGTRCHFALLDAASGAELRRAAAPNHTGSFQTITWEVADLHGREVCFVAVDDDPGPAYAWIAFDDLLLLP